MKFKYRSLMQQAEISIAAASIAVLLFSISLHAQEKPGDWVKFGISVVPENLQTPTDTKAPEKSDQNPDEAKTTDSGETDSGIISLTDKNGFPFTLKTELPAALTEAQMEKLIRLKDQIQSITLYKIKTMHFLYSERSLDSHILVDSFTCGKEELKDKIPAGLFFTLTDTLEYNFRFTDEKYFFRISGVYKDDDGICEKMADALRNPLRYLNRSDPTMVASRVETLDKELEKISVENWSLKLSIIALHNSGFFSGPKPVDKKSVSRIVSLKKKEPHISNEELFKRVESEKLKISRKEFELVMQVFFPE